MSTTSIDIVRGDGKFELIAQMIDCARGISWAKRPAFQIYLEGPMNTFTGDGRMVVVTAEVNTLILGAQSEDGKGDGWRLTGIILNRDNELQGTPRLRDFGRFEAFYDVRARTGSIKQVGAA
ncbi:MAG TPA: hypothetical protein VHC21_03810 [Candidatus Saccharimonadales bacterium]|nr:hypothetical protein [Candidatus Saccharimonadales bacterium]